MEKQIDSPLEKIETDNGEEIKKYYKKMYGDLGFILQKSKMKILDKYEVNGDLIINVKFGDARDVLGSIIDKTGKEAWIGLFEYYDRTILNFSILPIAGGLNNIKRQLGNDRLDTFIYVLSKFYEDENALILNSGSARRSISRCIVLNKFLHEQDIGTVNNFFSKIYGFNDRSLVDSMIESGSKAVINETNLGNYLKLAVKFWKLRFDSMLKNNVIKLSDTDREKVYDDLNTIWAGIENDLPGTDTTLKLF